MALALLGFEGNPPLVDPSEIKVSVIIQTNGDFTGRLDDFAASVAKTGFFTREVRESYERKKLTALQMVSHLPITMLDMARADSPIRSTVGKVLADLGVEAEHFEDHIEFLVGEQVTCETRSLPGYEFDDVTQERARRAIFGNPRIMAYLRGKERKAAHKKAAEAEVRAALAKYQMIERDRAAKGIVSPDPLPCSR